MKKILILGAGYAGMSVATRLKHCDCEITVVNGHNYHHLTTLLHQPAVGRITSYNVCYTKLLRGARRGPLRSAQGVCRAAGV